MYQQEKAFSGLMTRGAPRADAKRSGPPAANQSRLADIRRGSYDPQTRTFSAVLSTGADVKRFGYVEQLSLDPAAVDLSRVPLGQVKFIDSHNQGAVGALLGTLVSARVENGVLVGVVQLGESDAAHAAERDIASGHLTGVSIGYRVDQWTNVSAGDAEIWRADKWALYEASAVTVPADAGAMIRGDERSGDDDGAARRAPGGGAQMSAAASLKLLRRVDPLGERALAEQMIEAGESEDAVMRAALEAHRVKSQAKPPIGGPRAMMEEGHNARSFDNPAFLRSTLEDALYARMSGAKPTEAARQFMTARLDDYENILAEARGERRSWLSRSPGSWLGGSRGGAHTSSDFPMLLLGAGNRVLQDAYEAELSPLLMLAKVRTAADFRPINILRLSETPALEKLKEGGEVHYGSRAEEEAGFVVDTYAKIFSISRNAIINDDLGAFGDSNAAFGRGAAQTISAALVALFTANSGNGATLNDGNPLFSTTRGNKAGTAGPIHTGTLGGARQALRETKGLDGVTPIAMTPRYLVVGPAIETAAEQALAEIWAGQTSNANPFSGKLELLVEPRFTGIAWRVFADPARQAMISVAYLNGKRGPILEQRDGWTTLGMEFRAVLDFGCGVTDWRGSYLNAGA